ncbi:sugar porter family MFS transporter, partial [Streptomyces sp. NPDC000851]
MTSTAQAPQQGAKAAPPEHLGHVVFITAAAAMGGFLFGYDSSVINGANGGIQARFEVGHRQQVGLVELQVRVELVGELVTGAARAVA